MQKLLLFILLCLISTTKTKACGYYPYGEDVRFSMLKPAYIFPHSASYFFYDAKQFSFPSNPVKSHLSGKYEENLNLWSILLQNKASKKDIYNAIYEANGKELKNKKSSNLAIRQLNLPENKDVLNYLFFAKSISHLNEITNDPWEKRADDLSPERNKMIAKCIINSHKTRSKELKRRYAHLAIRLAYYNNDKDKLNQLYRSYFNRNELNDALDFWALHFKVQFAKSSSQRNLDAALVFAHSPEKRLQASKKIDSEFSFEECLSMVKTDLERSSLHFAYAVKSARPSFHHLREFSKNESDENKLLFLTLREVNKLEDWLLTPYFTAFEPTSHTTWEDSITGNMLLKRVVKDRQYAQEVSAWVREIRASKNLKNEWWSTIELYLDYMAGVSAGNLDRLDLERNKENLEVNQKDFLDKMYALSKISNATGEGLSELGLENLVFRLKESNQFLFTVGRALEFSGAKTEAASILSKVNVDDDYSDNVFWKTKNRNTTIGSDYYYDYYFYMDAAYHVEEVQAIIDYLKTGKTQSKFDTWKSLTLQKDLNRLYDLVGSKHLRKDNLEAALVSFKKIETSFWNEFRFTEYLDNDPFDNNFISNDIHASNKSYTKPEIIEKLIKLKAKVAASHGDQKAKNAFLVANCYRNMTYHGNSWLMRRYWWSGNHMNAGFEDDKEYIQANKAKKYYLLAMESAESEKFAAMSLRLAGACEKFKLYDEIEWDYQMEDYPQYIFEHNTLFTDLRNEFPEHYEPLISNCARMYTYFDALEE